MSTQVISSPNDPRHYQNITLDNQLKILLIRDTKASQAAASMTINVGHFDDPIERQGMAHFLEHMLFLGTHNHPKPNDFQTFINNHGGANNAWTGAEHTNFYFRIQSKYFEMALQRFSEFFISPCLDKQWIDKERHAIDSEFNLKIKDDLRRIFQVHKETVSQAHPFSKFSVGNLMTLGGDAQKLADELRNFYTTQYNANLMTLCLAGPFSLKKLEAMARKYFSAIGVQKTTKSYPDTPLYTPDLLNIRVNILPIKEQHKLTLCFPFPSLKHFYPHKPLIFLGHLIGYEGHGSAIGLLKKQGLITQLYAGGGIQGYNFKNFCISIDLTYEGLLKIDHIIKIIFEYLAIIKTSGIQNWRYQERSSLLQLAFNYQAQTELLDLVSYLSLNMQHYSIEDVIYGDYRAEGIIAEQFQSIFNLLTVENMRIQFVSSNIQADKISKWYKTPYSIEEFNSNSIECWQDLNENKQLFLPEKNPFIPTNTFKLIKEHQNNSIKNQSVIPPRIISQAKGYRFWYKNEMEFNEPKGHIFLSLDSSNACENLTQATLTRLYVELLLDFLSEYTYAAEIAGLSYNIYSHQAGITLHLKGFTEKQQDLLLLIIEKARQRDFSKERFYIIKQQVLNTWNNIQQARPISQLFSNLSVILQKSSFSSIDMAKKLEELTLDDLFEHLNQFYAQNHLEALIYGYWNEKQAHKLTEDITQLLNLITSPTKERKRELINLHQQGNIYSEITINHPDSAIIIYYQSQTTNVDDMALFSLLNHTMNSSFFYQLRTQQQLGYMVGTGYLPLQRHPGMIFYIQSPTYGPEELLGAIDDFITNFSKSILEISAHEWQQTKTGLIEQINEPEVNMQGRSQKYWSSIGNKDYQFDQRQRIVNAINSISQQNLLSLLESHFLSENADRLILFSTGNIHSRPTTFENIISNANITEFKQHSNKFVLIPDR